MRRRNVGCITKILGFLVVIGMIIGGFAYLLPETFMKGLEEVGLKQEKDSVTVVEKKDSIVVEEKSVEIPLEDESGVHYVVVKVCDIPMRFILDTGCSGIQVSPIEYYYLVKQGKLRNSDILPDSVITVNADGEINKSIAFVIPGLTVGDTTLHEVKCVINSNLHAPALLGQDVLGKLGTIQLDYKGGKLKVIR